MFSRGHSIALVALLLTACTADLGLQEPQAALLSGSAAGEKVELTAGFAGGTPGSSRTYLGPKEGNEWPNLWAEGDALSVNGVSSSALGEGEAGSPQAVFTLTGVSAPFYAAYPVSCVSSYADGTATLSLPSVQRYREDSYDPSAWVMLARSEDNSLHFVPQMAILSITPTGSGSDIRSVSFTDLGEGALSGSFTTDFSTIVPGPSGVSSTVTLRSEEGIPEGKPWRMVIPASDFRSSGFRLSVTTTDGRTFVRSGTPSKAYEAGRVYAIPVTLKPGSVPTVVLDAVTSSSLSFSWSHEGATVEEEIARSYLLSLYTDAACTQLFVSHHIPADASCWNNSRPRFVIGGLNPSTSYWFTVSDLSNGAVSAPVSGTTEAFSPVDARYVSKASAGQVILAEDFSEIGWGSSEFDCSAGFYPSVTDLTIPRGAISTDDGRYVVYNANQIRLFDVTSIPASSRLSGWGFFGNSSVYAYSGYLRIGVTASGARTHLVSPALAGIPNGKDAVIDVTVTSCRNEDNTNQVAVFLEDGSSLSQKNWKFYGVTLSEGYPLETQSRKWSTSTVRIAGVSNKHRLVFGSYSNIDTKNRFCITDIQVKIVSLSPSSKNKAQVKAASYNVLKPSGHPEESSLDKADVRDALYRTIALTGASIIGFNELDEKYIPGGTYALPDICSALGAQWKWELQWPNNVRYFQSYNYTYANGFAYDGSVLDLEDCGYVWLSKEEETWYPTGWAAYGNAGNPMRTCIWARMRHIGSGLRFYFLVSHLPTQKQGGGESMATGLNSFAESLDPSLPIILAGDMNSAASGDYTAPYDILREYWTDACESVAASGGTDMTSRGTLSGSSSSYYYSVSTFTRNHPERRIDHIMTRGACRASTYETPYATFKVDDTPWCPSDHLPVAVTIDFPKNNQ